MLRFGVTRWRRARHRRQTQGTAQMSGSRFYLTGNVATACAVLHPRPDTRLITVRPPASFHIRRLCDPGSGGQRPGESLSPQSSISGRVR